MARLFRRDRPLVRPWALAGPMIVLVLAAPLLRPLRSPGRPSPAERVTLETVRAVLHDHTLAVDERRLAPGDPVLRVAGRTVSQDPPAFDAMLAGVGWGIERFGVRADLNPHLFAYLLTLFAAALPTAVAGGLLYRTTRVFELRRPWRFGLALACVLASGWFGYATVLGPHAPAAAGVAVAVAGVIQFSRARRPGRAVFWMAAAGACAAGAGVIEPLAMWSLAAVLVAGVVVDVRRHWRVFGLILALCGAAAPVALHLTLNTPLTGDWKPPRWHTHDPAPPLAPAQDDPDAAVPSGWAGLGRGVGRLATLTVGSHGLLTHYPVLILGLAGAGIIVRRHWTASTKALAAGTVLGLALTLAYKMAGPPDAVDADYAAPRLVIFAPVLMLWAGAWLRRRHGPVVWAVSGVALAVSVVATLVGAAVPSPPDGYSHYTLAEAVERLVLSRHGE